MLAMVAADNDVHPGSKVLRAEEVTQAFGLVLADGNIYVAHLGYARELLKCVQQNRLAGDLGKLFFGLSRPRPGLGRHARSQTRRRPDYDYPLGTRRINQSRDPAN